jgi:hypothetical protein
MQHCACLVHATERTGPGRACPLRLRP